MAKTLHIKSVTVPMMTFNSMFSERPITSSYLLITNTSESVSTPPFTLLQLVSRQDEPARMILDTCNNIDLSGSSLRGRRTRGSYSSPEAVQFGDIMLHLTSDAYDGQQFAENSPTILFRAAENWNSSSHGTMIQFRTTNVGGTTARLSLQINPDGVTYGNFTGSFQGTASYALSSSWSSNGGGASLATGSAYPITASWAQHAFTASYIAIIPSGSTESASYALTASYAMNQGISIPKYDFSYIQYDGPYGQFSKCTYRRGGASGSIVSVVDAYYDGTQFIGVSKSLG